jgi:uncharacterized protein
MTTEENAVSTDQVASRDQPGEQGTAGGPPEISLVDCDVHPHFPEGLKTLSTYVSSSWAKRLGLNKEIKGKQGLSNAGAFSMPVNGYYNSPDAGPQLEAQPADGSPPSSTPAMVAEQLLDRHGTSRAILLSGNMFGLGAVPNGEVAATLARATNDWLSDVWLGADERFRAAIVVAPQDPQAAAAEIRRMADRPGVAQVFIPVGHQLLGEPFFHPIYDAATECGLPISVHPTGVESIYVNGPIAGTAPWYYLQFHTTLTLPQQANAVSLVAHGTFERYPDLRVVFTEVGIAWLLDTMWRMDKNWKGVRDEVPWVKRLPSEYMVEHFRFTTQPFPEPKRKEHLLELIEMIQGEQMLMFASDFPHWDGDDPKWTLDRAMPAELRRRVAYQNAVDLYGDKLH